MTFKYLSRLTTGPAVYKLNSNDAIISCSNLIRFYFVICARSSVDSKLIILLKLGLIGYSSLAAINIKVVASSTQLGKS